MESMIAESEQYDHLVAQYLREQSLSNRLTTEALECDDAMIRDEVRRQQQLQGKLVSQVINEVRSFITSTSAPCLCDCVWLCFF